MITTILFDLDGTLLPMDNDEFIKYYFGLLCKKAAPLGYTPEELTNAVWSGTGAMVKNNGTRSNMEVFWEKFENILGSRAKENYDLFDEFYHNEFNQAIAVCGRDERMINMVRNLKAGGYRVVLATNPIFPTVATENRIHWAGFELDDFELYTTYENIGYSKPNSEYYLEIARRLNVQPEECMMIGNDVIEDMIAKETGMEVFLLTRNIINKENKDYSIYPHGDVEEMIKLLESKTGLAL